MLQGGGGAHSAVLRNRKGEGGTPVILGNMIVGTGYTGLFCVKQEGKRKRTLGWSGKQDSGRRCTLACFGTRKAEGEAH